MALAVVGSRGWFVLTHDQRMRYKPNEQKAVLTNAIGMFVVIGSAPYPELADNVIATRERISNSSANIPARSSLKSTAHLIIEAVLGRWNCGFLNNYHVQIALLYMQLTGQ